jgi:hypothetical protein
MSYCSAVPAGGKASLRCLQENVARLSGECRRARAALGAV